jgi:hypothetical protein
VILTYFKIPQDPSHATAFSYLTQSILSAYAENHGLVRTENKVVNQKGETVLVYNPLRMMKGSKNGGHR